MVMAVEDSVVRVVVRVRPPTPKELESQRRPVIQVVDERMLVFDPEECDGGFPGLKWSGSHNGPKKKGKDLTFVFDRVFGEMATQEDVFQHTTHNILDSFLQGYNCSVFAYGATGAGKTQNCSTPLALPTRDLNTTFNVSEESPSKPSFQEFVDWEKVSPELNSTDQPFLPSAPVFIFTKGRKPSLPAVTASKKRRTMRPSVSRGRSCIARLHSSTLKKPNRPFTVPEPPLSPHCLDDQRTPKGLTGVTESY